MYTNLIWFVYCSGALQCSIIAEMCNGIPWSWNMQPDALLRLVQGGGGPGPGHLLARLRGEKCHFQLTILYLCVFIYLLLQRHLSHFAL